MRTHSIQLKDETKWIAKNGEVIKLRSWRNIWLAPKPAGYQHDPSRAAGDELLGTYELREIGS